MANGPDRVSTTDIDTDTDIDSPAEVEIETTRTEIRQTQASIADTLDAIKEKLNPGDLMDQAKDRVQEVAADVMDKAKTTVHSVVEDVSSHAQETAKGAVTGAVGGVVDEAKQAVGGMVDTAKGAGSTVIDTIKNNPLPAALLALSAFWLYTKHRDDNQSSYSPGRRTDYGRANGGSNGSDMTDQIKDKAGQAADAVGNVVDSAKQKAGEAVNAAKDTVGNVMDAAQNTGIGIIDTIKRNPVPAVATALGATWLYLKNVDENKGVHYERSQGRGGYASDSYSGYSSSNYTDSNGNGDGKGMMDQVKDKAGQAADAVGSVVNTAKEKTGQITQQAKEKTQQVGDSFQGALQESPLPIGLVALGIGAAIGFLAPHTEPENRFMGETRDRLMDKAQDAAQDLASKVQNVAKQGLDAATNTVKQEAQNQGLSPTEPDMTTPPSFAVP